MADPLDLQRAVLSVIVGAIVLIISVAGYMLISSHKESRLVEDMLKQKERMVKIEVRRASLRAMDSTQQSYQCSMQQQAAVHVHERLSGEEAAEGGWRHMQPLHAVSTQRHRNVQQSLRSDNTRPCTRRQSSRDYGWQSTQACQAWAVGRGGQRL